MEVPKGPTCRVTKDGMSKFTISLTAAICITCAEGIRLTQTELRQHF